MYAVTVVGTEEGQYWYFKCVEYARFADDLAGLMDAQESRPRLHRHVSHRQGEEFARLVVEIYEEKSRSVMRRKYQAYMSRDVRRQP